MALPPGTRLGPYEILAPIGAGGMGEVYRARDPRLERTVAIKVLPAQLSKDSEFRARFEREARLVSRLNHPNICVLHDIGHQDPSTGSEQAIDYLVMEYLEGEAQADRLAKGPLPLPQALRIGVNIADALDRVVKTCLAKDPDQRRQSAHDLADELRWIAEAGLQAGATSPVASARHGRTSRIAWGIAAGVILLAALLATFLVWVPHQESAEAEQVMRVQFIPPKGERHYFSGNDRAFAISTDSSLLVYAIEEGASSALRLRPMNSEESVPIRGTEGASYPFFSPDGKRFLVAEDPNPSAQTKLNVVVNWFAEVRRKVQEAHTP